MKAEIEKILLGKYLWTELVTKELTEELTTLIIKWLESKKKELLIMPTYQCNGKITQEVINKEELGRNQLLTELIEEMR